MPDLPVKEVVAITTTQKYTVAEALEILEKTPQWLIDETELSPGVVYRTLDDSPIGLKTHITSAEVIANALGLEVEDVRWHRGLSNTGRNALSGGVIVERTTVTKVTVEREVTYQMVCRACNLVMPATGVCEDCPPVGAAA